MACGCPNVVQGLKVFYEVAGDSAVYVDFADAEGAAKELERVCSDDLLASALREAGLVQSRRVSFERLARERVGYVVEKLRELPR